MGSDKDRNLCCFTGSATVGECKAVFPAKSFKVDSRIPLDMKSELSGICPFAASSAKLSVTHGFPVIHNTNGIVLLPEVLELLLPYGQEPYKQLPLKSRYRSCSADTPGFLYKMLDVPLATSQADMKARITL